MSNEAKVELKLVTPDARPPLELIQAYLDVLRKNIQFLKEDAANAMSHPFFQEPDVPLTLGNVPPSRAHNMCANLVLAFRHLEDARMRIGKVLQASQGGVSILDKQDDA